MDSPLHQHSAELGDCCYGSVVFANQTNEPHILLKVYRAVCAVESDFYPYYFTVCTCIFFS